MHPVIDKATATEYVVMTPREAERLGAAIGEARARLRGLIVNVQTQRFMDAEYQRRELAELRAQLASLDAFHKAHEEAHGLPIRLTP